ncbi:MAG: DUF4160 domain-containing protein [Woeseiaceae bacterium]
MGKKGLEDRTRELRSLDEAAEIRSELLTGGYSVWTNGSLYEIKQLVARVKGLKIHVYADEHPPPHFHVKSADVDAVFTIDDCTFIRGNIDGRERNLVYWWYQHARAQLVATWNATRPSDCPVGPIAE